MSDGQLRFPLGVPVSVQRIMPDVLNLVQGLTVAAAAAAVRTNCYSGADGESCTIYRNHHGRFGADWSYLPAPGTSSSAPLL